MSVSLRILYRDEAYQYPRTLMHLLPFWDASLGIEVFQNVLMGSHMKIFAMRIETV